jgi:Ca2+-binding RTX toxin-like protein
MKGSDQGDILIPGLSPIARLGVNILHGGAGNDILFGSPGDDKLYGDGDDDLLIGSGGNDTFDGGADNEKNVAYYGNFTTGISYEAGSMTKSSGVDKLTNVQIVIGTPTGDTFKGDGKGMTFYGRGGINTYYAGDGPDAFLGDFQSAFPVGNDRLDFSLSKSAVKLTTTSIALGGSTESGVTFQGIGRIDGSAYDDVFHAEFAQFNTTRTIYGGDGNDTFYIGRGQRESHGGAGSDIFVITSMAGEANVNGGYSENDDDSLDFSGAKPGVVVNLANNSFVANGYTGYFTGIERFEFGGTSVTINGSEYVDNIRTGSGKSTVNAGGGNDHITVLPVDNATPAGLSVNDVIINGGVGNDVIVAYRAATIDGGADDDDITGSYAKDVIRGGAGNDRIDAGGGSEEFKENPNGIDRIDAGIGLGDIDRFWGDMSKANYNFRLTNERPDELGISLVGGDETKDKLRFVNLEQVAFYANSYSSETINVSTIIQLLNQDADHRMTGTELGVALRGTTQARSYSTMTMDNSSVDDGSSVPDAVIYDALDPQTLDFTGIYFTSTPEERQAGLDQGIWPTAPEVASDVFGYTSGWDAPYDPMGSQWGQMAIAPFHGDYIL